MGKVRGMSDGRCFAVVGTAYSGPAFCGRPAKGVDEAGRPVCGLHVRRRQHAESWEPAVAYPRGKGGAWKFQYGDQREGRGTP